MNLVRLVWLIAIHSVVHGALGAFFIASSEYVNKQPGLIYSFMVVNIILIILGVVVCCVIIWRRPACAKLVALLLGLLALIYLIIGIIYFVEYAPFFANSVIDRDLYYNDTECWVGPEYPITFWHIIMTLLLLFMFVWFLYGFLLWRLARQACCIPCPPAVCKPKPRCPAPCCYKLKWYQKIIRPKCLPFDPPPCAEAHCETPPDPLCIPPPCPSQTPPPPPPPLPPPSSPCSFSPPPQPFLSECVPPCSMPKFAPQFHGCPPPPPPPPAAPAPPAPPPLSPQPNLQPRPQQCSATKKGPKFVLTLKTGK